GCWALSVVRFLISPFFLFLLNRNSLVARTRSLQPGIHCRKFAAKSAPRTTQRTDALRERTNRHRRKSIATRNEVVRRPGSFRRRYTSDYARTDTAHGSRVFLADRTARACLCR